MLVLVKGDARSQAPSSSTLGMLRFFRGCDRSAGLGFAGFALLHLAEQALRAHDDGAVREAGFELQPLFVGSLLTLVCLPLTVFAWRALRSQALASDAFTLSEKARALAILERVSLLGVLLFSLVHVAHVAWPLLSGAQAPSDVRLELIAALSSTRHGVPLVAVGYVFGVGASAFFGARQLRWANTGRGRAWTRVSVALGVFAYLLGSYAVIRCASGPILP
jgi:hypothetical protein